LNWSWSDKGGGWASGWANGKSVALDTESEGIGNIVGTDFSAGGIDVGVRSTNVSGGITSLSSGLSWVGITVRRLS
jgi:hypothetical protein